jgi:hypothetical protein
MSFTLERLGPSDFPPTLVETPSTPDPPDFLDDLPPFMQQSRQVQAVLTAIGNEAARLEGAREDLIANYFPATADALLHFYENMLGLSVDNPLLTLAQRRSAVQAFIRRIRASAGTDWQEIITTLIGNTWTYQEHDPADMSSPAPYTVLIRVPYGGPAATPTGLAVAQHSLTGHLAAGTYYYAVTAVTSYGETCACAPQSLTVAANAVVRATFNGQIPPALTFNIYRGGSATTLKKVGSVANPGVGTGNVTYDDDGSSTPGAAPPGTDSSASTNAVTVQNLARSITPAHLTLNVGFTSGFIVGVSLVGIDAL